MYLGDVAPFIPVARRLHAAGHDVVFVAPEGFRDLLEAEPFAFHPYGLDASPAAMDADPVHTRLMRHPFRNVARLGRYWMDKGFTDDPDAAVASLEQAFDGSRVVVTHPTMATVTMPVARAVGARVVVGQLFPMMIPTGRWTPPLGSRSPNLGRPLNRAVWGFMDTMAQLTMRDRELNQVRERLDQPPVRANASRAWLEADRTVVLASQHFYGAGADDWPPVTWGGFSIWDGPPGRELPEGLAEFLDAGDPPVLVTLGTSAATDAGARFARIADDLDALGLRSVLLVGHERNLGPVASRPGAVRFAPITQVLPRCRAAVISGALGGLAATLGAGLPVVVHPQLFDQVWNGRRAEQLGVGASAKGPADVAAAVRRVTEDPSHTERASALSRQMSGEDAPGAVLAAVEEHCDRPSAPG